MVDELQERIMFLQNQIEKSSSKFEIWKEDLKIVFEEEIQKIE